MKKGTFNLRSVLICILLVVLAVGIGAYRGWSEERELALYAKSGNGELYETIQNRAMDAANLHVVASRYLPDDHADLVRLRKAYRLLLDGKGDVDDIVAADQVITEVATDFAAQFPNLGGKPLSERDSVYISNLTRILRDDSGIRSAYAAVLQDFNDRLSSSLTGKLASLLGISPLQMPDAQ